MRSYSGQTKYTKRKRSSNDEVPTDRTVGGNAGKIPTAISKFGKLIDI